MARKTINEETLYLFFACVTFLYELTTYANNDNKEREKQNYTVLFFFQVFLTHQ